MNGVRWAGVVLLVVAGVAAAVVTRLKVQRIAGSPAVDVAIASPAVGDCVVTRLDGSPPTSYLLSDGTQVTLAAAVFGDCNQPIYAEVTSVPISRGAETRDFVAHVRAVDGCGIAAAEYIGLTRARSRFPLASTQTVAWEPALDSAAIAVGPSARERAAGASWVACLVGPSSAESYPSSTRDVFGLPIGLPWMLRTCSKDPLPDATLTACTEPHRSQLLGWAYFNPATSADAEIDNGCRYFASAMLNVADPTAGGALTISGTRMQPGGAFVICSAAVTGDVPLVNSLLGIGSNPLPLGR